MSDEEKLPRVLPKEVPDYHERQAAHLSALAETAKAPAVKHRLVQEAKLHKRLAMTKQLLNVGGATKWRVGIGRAVTKFRA